MSDETPESVHGDSPVTKTAAALAYARWEQTLGKPEQYDHLQIDGEGQFFSELISALSNNVHDHLHEKFGTCKPDDGEEGSMPDFNTEIIKMAFMFGRAIEEQAVLKLLRDGEFDLPTNS